MNTGWFFHPVVFFLYYSLSSTLSSTASEIFSSLFWPLSVLWPFFFLSWSINGNWSLLEWRILFSVTISNKFAFFKFFYFNDLFITTSVIISFWSKFFSLITELLNCNLGDQNSHSNWTGLFAAIYFFSSKKNFKEPLDEN